MSINLTPEQIDQLNAYGDQIAAVELEISRAKQAGIDVSDLETRLNKVKAMREGLLSVYGPQKPSRPRRIL
jgi:hypothetical protein